MIPHSTRQFKNYVKFKINMNVYRRKFDGYVMSNNSDCHNLCLFNLSNVRSPQPHSAFVFVWTFYPWSRFCK